MIDKLIEMIDNLKDMIDKLIEIIDVTKRPFNYLYD